MDWQLVARYFTVKSMGFFYSEQFSTFNIAHISKFAVDFYLIMMSKPKYIVLTRLFVASGKRYFALLLVFFRKYFSKGCFFGMTLRPLVWQAKPRPTRFQLRFGHSFEKKC